MHNDTIFAIHLTQICILLASFNKEKSIYPESAHFMNRIIKKVELAEGKAK